MTGVLWRTWRLHGRVGLWAHLGVFGFAWISLNHHRNYRTIACVGGGVSPLGMAPLFKLITC